MKESIADIKRKLRPYGEVTGMRRRITYNFGRYEDKRKRVRCRAFLMSSSPLHLYFCVAEEKTWKGAWISLLLKVQGLVRAHVEGVEREVRNRTST